MRVLMVTSSYPTGSSPAAGGFVHDMAAAMQDAGHSVVIAAPRSDKAKDVEVPVGVELSSKSGMFYGLGVEQNLKRNPLKLFPLAMDVLKALPKLSLLAPLSDVVVVHWLYPYGAAIARMRRVWNRPVVVVLHSVNPLAFGLSPFTGKAVEMTDLFIAVSESVKHAFLGALPKRLQAIAGRKIKVIPMGVPAGPGMLRTGPPHGQPLKCLFLGRLIRIKGPDIVVKAVRDLENVRLTVAGNGTMFGKLKDLANHENTRFLGPVDRKDVPGLMAAHDCLLLPSRRLFGGRQEGNPMVLKEAAVSGLPVITTAYGGQADFIKQYGNGKVVEATPDGFRQELMALQAQPELLKEFSERALDAASHITWNTLIPKWMDALNGVL